VWVHGNLADGAPIRFRAGAGTAELVGRQCAEGWLVVAHTRGSQGGGARAGDEGSTEWRYLLRRAAGYHVEYEYATVAEVRARLLPVTPFTSAPHREEPGSRTPHAWAPPRSSL